MNDEEFASFLWALENTVLSWAVDDLRARDAAQREALEQVNAERHALRDQVIKSDAVAMANHFACDTAQAHLAEAIALLREISSTKIIFNAEKFELNRRLVAFLARHAQADEGE